MLALSACAIALGFADASADVSWIALSEQKYSVSGSRVAARAGSLYATYGENELRFLVTLTSPTVRVRHETIVKLLI